MLKVPRYGRMLDDFTPGAIYAHPWEVTIDEGMMALFAASFQCATPTYSSRAAARGLGLRDRPVHPLLLLNLGVSFSVHDVSEQAVAHLAYMDVRFPAACYAGDTVTASTRVLGVKPVSSNDKGVVHVRTELRNQDDEVVCAFERKALVRTGSSGGRPPDPPHDVHHEFLEPARLPRVLAGDLPPRTRRGGFATFFEDFAPGDVIAHAVGRTVSEAEAMQMATLVRNSHPLHTDEHYAKHHSFARTRVVYGGLVLAWALSLASRDTTGNAVWETGLDDGAHPSGVLAGDTLYAASKVLSAEVRGPTSGVVTLRVVATKNVPARVLLEQGADLFTPELGKTEGKVPEKAVEITRRLLVRRREA
jgi:2-methylfumaryl-CoA hydratase